MKIDVDVDQLRESQLDRAGSAAGVGFPAAMLDVMDIEDESPQELLTRAERKASTSATLPSTMTTERLTTGDPGSVHSFVPEI